MLEMCLGCTGNSHLNRYIHFNTIGVFVNYKRETIIVFNT